jgi:hypothetical protein
MLRCWHLVWILVRTDHPCLGVGCHRAPEYYSWLYEEHSLQHCEVYVDIPSHPVFPDGSPWSTWAIGADMDDAMEKAAHMALTVMCSQNLAATAGTPISLYPIQDRSDPK